MPRAKSTQTSQSRTTRPVDAMAEIKHLIKINRPVMIWGAPGIGKSDIVKQIGEIEKREVIDIRLPLWEPTDIKVFHFTIPNPT